MGIFFERQPTASQEAVLEAALQPHLQEALTTEAQSSERASQLAGEATNAVLSVDNLRQLSEPARRRISSSIQELMVASYKSAPMHPAAAPSVAATTAHTIATQSAAKQIIWWRLGLAVAILVVISVAAIWTEAAGLKTAPDNLWKIASAGIGSVVGLLIGEGTN